MRPKDDDCETGSGRSATEGDKTAIARQGDIHETLDPQDWEWFRRFLNRVSDDVVDFLGSISGQPVWRQVPSDAQFALNKELPTESEDLEAVYAEFISAVRPFGAGNIHPRFWGWALGSGCPTGMVADFLASSMNTSVSNFDQVPALVELQVVEWLRKLLGFPGGAGGIMVSGCSEANLLGIAMARNVKAPFDVREKGLSGGGLQLALYCSEQTHSSVMRAVEILGIGRRGLRSVRVNSDWTIDIDHLSSLIEKDRRKGLLPFCVVGNAGTVNTGAVDCLSELARLSRENELWFHVDGALGFAALLSPNLAGLVRGIQEADSVALDLHKFIHQPFDVGCLVSRVGELQRKSFAFDVEYFKSIKGGICDGKVNFAEWGIQTTRSFKALKVWFSLKVEGISKFGRLVEKGVLLAQHMAGIIAADPRLQLMAPVPLNVVVFRYVGKERAEERLAAMNLEIMLAMQRDGVAVVSSTILNGRFCLRACVMNHRTGREDIEFLIQEIIRRGDEANALGGVE